MLCPKSVLITGANRGVGLEFVKQFAALDSPPKHIFAGCRNVTDAQDLHNIAKETSSSSIHVLKLDVTQGEDIKSSLQKVSEVVGKQGLNLLINNAAIFDWAGALDEVTAEQMINYYSVNTVGPLMVTQAALPLLKLASSTEDASPSCMSCSKAAIVNISSQSGSLGGTFLDEFLGGRYPYRCSKAALNMAALTMAHDLRPHGILVANLTPGWTRTRMGGEKAPLMVEDSVRGMMANIASMTEKDSPSFRNYKGDVIAW